MTEKLKNPYLLDLLNYAAKTAAALPRWLPVNEFARSLSLQFAAPALEALLQKSVPAIKIRLLPRHSVATPTAFNIFLSDIDFSLIIESSTSSTMIDRLVRSYESMANRFWPLGELEIYTEPEWALLQNISEDDHRIIEFVRNLRKLRWQLDRFAQGSSAYHRTKAERSVRILLSKLGMNEPAETLNVTSSEVARVIRQLDHIWLPQGMETGPVTGYSNFLGWTLESTSAAFVAILPHGEEVTVGLRVPIARLRENREIGRRFALISISELLLTRSKRRAAPESFDLKWENYLSEMIRQYAPATDWRDFSNGSNTD